MCSSAAAGTELRLVTNEMEAPVSNRARAVSYLPEGDSKMTWLVIWSIACAVLEPTVFTEAVSGERDGQWN